MPRFQFNMQFALVRMFGFAVAKAADVGMEPTSVPVVSPFQWCGQSKKILYSRVHQAAPAILYVSINQTKRS